MTNLPSAPVQSRAPAASGPRIVAVARRVRGLHPREEALLFALHDLRRERGRWPTYRELGDRLDWGGPRRGKSVHGSIWSWADRLISRGFLRRARYGDRTLRLAPDITIGPDGAGGRAVYHVDPVEASDGP